MSSTSGRIFVVGTYQGLLRDGQPFKILVADSTSYYYCMLLHVIEDDERGFIYFLCSVGQSWPVRKGLYVFRDPQFLFVTLCRELQPKEPTSVSDAGSAHHPRPLSLSDPPSSVRMRH